MLSSKQRSAPASRFPWHRKCCEDLTHQTPFKIMPKCPKPTMPTKALEGESPEATGRFQWKGWWLGFLDELRRRRGYAHLNERRDGLAVRAEEVAGRQDHLHGMPQLLARSDARPADGGARDR